MSSVRTIAPSRLMQNGVGLALTLLGGIMAVYTMTTPEADTTTYLVIGFSTIALGVVVLGLARVKGKLLDSELDLTTTTARYVEETLQLKEEIPTRTLDAVTQEQRREYARKRAQTETLPGENAPRYSIVAHGAAANLLVRPSACPVTPMYLLDGAYRVMDWNEAFSLAFDKTMEGRHGRSVLEWTYFLDNYEAVLEHGMARFGDPDNLPPIDIEPIHYTSMRYGRIQAVKRAYQIPDDDGSCLAWLITIDPTFESERTEERYREDLQRILGLDQLWSEYAFSYDKVLNETTVYKDLLRSLIGETGEQPRITDGSRILDLGAGTGNLSRRVMDVCPASFVVALDNNRTMLDMLRTKCRRFLRKDDQGAGVLVSKQDVSSLYGLDDNSFDYVLSNNVFYALADVDSCLREIHRVLKPGGELRMSGPRVDTDLKVLFARIRADLKEGGELEHLRGEYEHVLQLNELRLRPMLHRWTTEQFAKLLTGPRIGFAGIVHSSEDVYAGQSMLMTAVK